MLFRNDRRCIKVRTAPVIALQIFVQRKVTQLMKLKAHWILILIIFVSISIFGLIRPGRSSSAPPWEYKVVSFDYADRPSVEKAFNELGAQGWELVLHQQSVDRYYFKRQK